MTTNGALRSSTGQCKVVNADHETPNIPISSSKLNNLHGVSFLSDSDSCVTQNNEEKTTKVLQCKLPPKEQNSGNFTLLCTIGDFNFYAMADLGASVNVMPRGIYEFLKPTNLRETNMLIEIADMTKKAPLGVVENILVGIDKFLFPSNFVAFDLLRDALSAIFGLSELKEINRHGMQDAFGLYFLDCRLKDVGGYNLGNVPAIGRRLSRPTQPVIVWYVLWKPSRDFTRPLGPPSSLKGLLHMLNATVIPTKAS
ncbi:phospholipase-like protein [Tanacetum coccineum]